MEIGQNVRLKGYNNKELLRRVVGVKTDMVIVCTEDEYKKASQEKREPRSIAFNMKYVIGN
jgi:hypothetical protein